MKINRKTFLLCDCQGTMSLDGGALAEACGGDGDLVIHTHLCRGQMERFEAALSNGESLIVACTQEAPLFSEVAADESPDAALGFFHPLHGRPGPEVHPLFHQALRDHF